MFLIENLWPLPRESRLLTLKNSHTPYHTTPQNAFSAQAVEKKLLDVWVANSIRMFRARPKQAIIDDAGWHMSFFADATGVSTKLKACAHDHWRNAGMAGDTERISKGMQEGEDMFYGG